MSKKDLTTILTGNYVDGIELKYYTILSNAIDKCKLQQKNKEGNDYYKNITNCVNKFHTINKNNVLIKIYYLHKISVKDTFLLMNLSYDKYVKPLIKSK